MIAELQRSPRLFSTHSIMTWLLKVDIDDRIIISYEGRQLAKEVITVHFSNCILFGYRA